MSKRTITLVVDELDYDVIHKEVAERQAISHKNSGGMILPDGDSDLLGAIIAECVRDLVEYRNLWEAEHPKEK